MFTIVFDKDSVPMLRAALAAAGKNDVRYYLNGIHISSNRICGTDGCRMVVFDHGKDIGDAEIIIPTFKVPKSTVEVVIEANEGKVDIYQYNRARIMTQTVHSPIDGKYPDYQRVLPQGPIIPVDSIAINPQLLADIHKELDDYACVMEFRDKTSGVLCTWPKHPQLKAVIMPTRV